MSYPTIHLLKNFINKCLGAQGHLLNNEIIQLKLIKLFKEAPVNTEIITPTSQTVSLASTCSSPSNPSIAPHYLTQL